MPIIVAATTRMPCDNDQDINTQFYVEMSWFRAVAGGLIFKENVLFAA